MGPARSLDRPRQILPSPPPSPSLALAPSSGLSQPTPPPLVAVLNSSWDRDQPPATPQSRAGNDRPFSGQQIDGINGSQTPSKGTNPLGPRRPPRLSSEPMIGPLRARSSVGERSLHTREVAGSKPAGPIPQNAPCRPRRGPGEDPMPSGSTPRLQRQAGRWRRHEARQRRRCVAQGPEIKAPPPPLHSGPTSPPRLAVGADQKLLVQAPQLIGAEVGIAQDAGEGAATDFYAAGVIWSNCSEIASQYSCPGGPPTSNGTPAKRRSGAISSARLRAPLASM